MNTTFLNTIVNPIEPTQALLSPQMPGVYLRQMVYDPTWSDPLYNSFQGQRIVPAVGSLVRDTDLTPLWVIAIDPDLLTPTYSTVPVSTENENIVSILNYGNTVLRLYVDKRAKPYPVTPDSKCIFIGKSPRFYTLTRYPNTPRESVISQYFDATGKLVSQMIPLVAQDATKSSWYLPRGNVAVILDENEEIEVKIFSEDGLAVYSAILHTKESTVINEDVVYSPNIVGITTSGLQQLPDGSYYVYENQSFDSLGLTATLIYDDGNTTILPIDGIKCILYGQTDFIASSAGLVQPMTVKYFRSANEAILPGLADATGQMVSIDIKVVVIPNELGITVKIVPIPMWNATLSRYIIRHWMYFADGRSSIDVSAYVQYGIDTLDTTPASFGIQQRYVATIDMAKADPNNYKTQANYQQNIVITLSPPTVLTKYVFKDSDTSRYVYGQDNVQSRRPILRYDATLKKYFVPTAIFSNVNAFLRSFYNQASPPYDPSVSLIPQVPTHFVVRDIVSGSLLTNTPIPVSTYGTAFTAIGDTTGQHLGTSVMVEFLFLTNSSQGNVLFGAPVDVYAGSFTG